MQRVVFVFLLFLLNASGVLFAQKAADPTHRYFRIIALVHLTGSGKPGDPIIPEYVAQGTAIAQAATIAAATATSTTPAQPSLATAQPIAGAPVSPSASASPRPGFLGWSMQITDNGTMAIIHIVAADPTAFAAILADTRPEIRVFQIGKDSAATIQATMQQYKKNFNLDSFEVMAQ